MTHGHVLCQNKLTAILKRNKSSGEVGRSFINRKYQAGLKSHPD